MKFAAVFPGQGSQRVGMLQEIATTQPVIEHTFAEASAVLGYDLWRLTQQGPESDLNQTIHTQPVLLTASVALWRAWQQAKGPEPSLLAGHSLGEYVALVIAGALQFNDALHLVAKRGELMQSAVPADQGAMAAVLGLNDDKIVTACQEAAEITQACVMPANYNAPGQVVIAGEKAAVEKAIELCKAAGAKRAIALPVSIPSHCALMKSASEQFAHVLAKTPMVSPRISVLHNVDVDTHTHPDDIRACLVAQLYSPVRWVETVKTLADEGLKVVIECGPGNVLAGLNKRIDERLQTLSIAQPDGLEQALTCVAGV